MPTLDRSSKTQLWMVIASVAALILSGLVNFLWVFGTWLIVMYLLIRLVMAEEDLQRTEVERSRLQYLLEHPDEIQSRNSES